MFSGGNLLLLVIAGLAGLYWWQSGVYKGRARDLATAHCRELGLQLIDQSMVITGFWPARAANGRLEFRRTYQFEFSSTGDRRYRGRLVLLGMRLHSIELEAYRLPDSE
jgi:hypothetical protein